MKNHADLKNPYEPQEEKRRSCPWSWISRGLTRFCAGLSQQEAMAVATLKAKEHTGYSDGLVGVIQEAVELEEEK